MFTSILRTLRADLPYLTAFAGLCVLCASGFMILLTESRLAFYSVWALAVCLIMGGVCWADLRRSWK